MFKRAFVTGATGFIGKRLVARLVADGHRVTCLVRNPARLPAAIAADCQVVQGDMTGEFLSSSARQRYDVVFHTAACTRAITAKQFMKTNPAGTKNVLEQFAAQLSPPVFVCVSSLAAVGPAADFRPHDETAPCQPISLYGRSKAASEREAQRFADRYPVSIVRPPVVIGGGDDRGLALFRTLQNFNLHLVPGFSDSRYSIIHVDDLVTALIAVADRGRRADSAGDRSTGIYFATSDETFSYIQLGQQIARAVGRTKPHVLHVPKTILWLMAGLNEGVSRCTGWPRFLKVDKVRDMLAGSWICSNQKITSEIGFQLTVSMSDRIQQTANWYMEHGWLERAPTSVAAPRPSSHRIVG